MDLMRVRIVGLSMLSRRGRSFWGNLRPMQDVYIVCRKAVGTGEKSHPFKFRGNGLRWELHSRVDEMVGHSYYTLVASA